ncbi:MAG: hypothetical protein EB117_09255 [Betaproteobacteria bacterium]|nr:hypothetical protein [Betaproteobacteria bacterium]
MTKILEKSFSLADYARQTFVARPAAGTTIDDVLNENYWSNVAKKMNPHDIIEVVPEDGAFYAKLIITSRGNLWARVHKLEHVVIGAAPVANKKPVEGFEIGWAGPNDKWRVVRKEDKAVVGKNFTSREDADKWLGEHIKELAA